MGRFYIQIPRRTEDEDNGKSGVAVLEPKDDVLRLKNNGRVYAFLEVTEQQFEHAWQAGLTSMLGLEGFKLLMSPEIRLRFDSPESWEVVEPGKPVQHLRLVHSRKETNE